MTQNKNYHRFPNAEKIKVRFVELSFKANINGSQTRVAKMTQRGNVSVCQPTYVKVNG